MIIGVLSIATVVLYLLSSHIQWRATQAQACIEDYRKPIMIGVLAWLMHTVSLGFSTFSAQGLLLDLSTTLSLVAWCTTGLLILLSIKNATASLLVCMYLISTTFVLFDFLSAPSSLPIHYPVGVWGHIVLSLLAYSLLAISVLMALVVALQNQALKQHKVSLFLRILPPLQAMETLLFELIFSGVILLTLALASGFLFVDNILEQRLTHKTVLSVGAWAIFVSLLIGHYFQGWRGRTAVIWTLSGFAFLLLSYFGSKWVIEYLL